MKTNELNNPLSSCKKKGDLKDISHYYSPTKLVFFLRKKQDVGGGLLLFWRLAQYIAHQKNYDEVYYVNFRNFDVDMLNIDCNIRFREVDSADYSEFEGADFVLPLNNICILLEKAAYLKYGRIILFDWSPYIVNYYANQFFYRTRNIQSMLSLFNDNNSIVYMDKGCYLGSNRWFQNISKKDPSYVPATFSNEKKDFIQLRRVDSNIINIGWMGRLDNDKIFSLINLLDNLTELQTNKLIYIHIIGDGNMRKQIDLEKYKNKIHFVFTSTLYGEARDRYIIRNIDLMIAMGMSALDTANLSIPTLIPIVSNTFFYNNEFVFLFDTVGYCLGWGIDDINNLGCQTYTISEAIDLVYTDSGKELLGYRCWKFCHENFSIEKSAQLLINAIKNTTLTLNDCWNNLQINKQMKACKFYTRIRKKRSYEDFAQFIIKFNRLQNKNFLAKIWGVIKILTSPIRRRCRKITNKVDFWIQKKENLKFYLQIQAKYLEKIEKIRVDYKIKKCLKAIFLVMYNTTFPTEPIFEKMLQDPCFDPFIMVIPDMQRSFLHRQRTYNVTYEELFKKYGNRVLHGANLEEASFFEPGDSYQLAFFNNPYIRMAHEYHHITYFLDKNVLTFYVNYGFAAVKYGRIIMRTNFYNLIWKACLDSDISRCDVEKHEPLKGKNTLVTGYIKMDRLPNAPVYPRDRKRIIISPHHTVLGWKSLDISNFLLYSEFFIELPRLYPQIDFVFRPHQLLFSNLRENNIWSQQDVDDYLARMLTSHNIKYDTGGDYFELFANSDGMIHDCSSFIGEYLFTEKPCCYMLKSKKQIRKVCNPMGVKCMQHYYKAFSKEDIIKFLDDVIIGGVDPLKESREEFVKKELKFNYPYATDTILHVIKDTLYI